MGSVYQRKVKVCRTCGSPRVKACEAAGHDIEIKILPTWWIRYNRDGRSYFESSESEKKTEAQSLLRKREGAIENGFAVTSKIGKVRFEDAAKDLETEYKVNGRKSLPDLTRRLDKHLLPFFRGKRLSHVTTAVVRDYIAKRQADTIVVRSARTITHEDGGSETFPEVTKNVSNAEINRELSALKRLFTLAVQSGKAAQRPYIPMLREDNVRRGFFEPHEYVAVLRHLPEDLRPVMTFAYITGWRTQSEILPLQWRQVDFDAGEVRLDAGTTKNGEGRVFPMTRDLRELLKAQQKDADRLKKQSGKIPLWVFQRNGKPISCMRDAWKNACAAAHVPGRIMHDLRRTAVRNLVRAGIPERVAMQMTGHKTRSVFERYNIVSNGDLKDAARRLDGERPAAAAV
jgi:integrase